MDPRIKQLVIKKAELYENKDFILHDPSRILYKFNEKKDIELAAFVSAMLSFGRREQFLDKIDVVLKEVDKVGSFYLWIKEGIYRNSIFGCQQGNVQSNEKKFYRFYSYFDMFMLFSKLEEILRKNNTLEAFCKVKYLECSDGIKFIHTFCSCFNDVKIVPSGINCSNKRINMFLRWMVRRNSPVDIGIWSWYRESDLIIPLDTHVLQVSKQLGLIPENARDSLKTAILITNELKQVWPNDPCKGDFALFGFGIDSSYVHQ